MTEPATFTFADDGAIPNSKLPLLVEVERLAERLAAILGCASRTRRQAGVLAPRRVSPRGWVRVTVRYAVSHPARPRRNARETPGARPA